MQWKKSYYIATNVSSRKSATTFGDLPDWLKDTVIIITNIHVHLLAIHAVVLL